MQGVGVWEGECANVSVQYFGRLGVQEGECEWDFEGVDVCRC